ncbi:MAG: hypothetical protein JWM11_447 [Planctomycetaceae bacterium]|nr:hypothetical protein [Planctomycetaceae bacterium]
MFYGELARLCLAITLLLRGGDPDLIVSIRNGNSAVAQKLIAKGADVNAVDSTKKTALYVAIQRGDKESYQQLLDKGANPNLCDWVGTSAVHLAAEQADVFWLREALKHGGNPNLPNTGNAANPNSRPLFYAIYKNRDENALALVAAGADINHVDGNNNTPLYACMGHGRFSLMIKLIEAGADPKPPEPAFSIFENGWFSENYENLFGVFSTDTEAEIIQSKADYFALKSLLTKKGFFKPTP